MFVNVKHEFTYVRSNAHIHFSTSRSSAALMWGGATCPSTHAVGGYSWSSGTAASVVPTWSDTWHWDVRVDDANWGISGGFRVKMCWILGGVE